MAASDDPGEFDVPASAEGHRVDVFVASVIPSLSRQQAKALARKRCIRVSGRPVAGSTRLRAGDTVSIDVPPPAAPEAIHAVRVLHRDDAFVYLYKPAGMHTVRLRPSDAPTLADAVRDIEPDCEGASPDPRECGALHRLDHGTSGVVAFARTPEAWARGRSALTHGAWKLYLAEARQPAPVWPPTGGPYIRVLEEAPRWPSDAPSPPPIGTGVSVTWPLAARGPRGRRVVADDAGQPAMSRIWPLTDERKVFAVELVTGRRHQVRVHMATLGLPLRGDTVYGACEAPDRLRLHAWALQLSADAPLVCADPPPWARG